ncbi:MAG: VOC family protein [Actinobacteria bacterium]|nr:VOC family protein [Actinomycetota bacterium]
MTALLVADYDEAIGYFVGRVGMALVEDTDLGAGKRWVRVGSDDRTVLLAKASNPQQQSLIGLQHAGRVGFFVNTDDFEIDYARMSAAGIAFTEAPRREEYGSVAVFADLYGNLWDLIGAPG